MSIAVYKVVCSGDSPLGKVDIIGLCSAPKINEREISMMWHPGWMERSRPSILSYCLVPEGTVLCKWIEPIRLVEED